MNFIFKFQSIEFFLTKDITHFITDKEEPNYYRIATSSQQQQSPATSTPQTPLTPNYLSPSITRTSSSNDLKVKFIVLIRVGKM